MSRPLRTVVVGFGRIADGLGDDPRMARFFRFATHAQVLAEHPAFAWEAVVDTSDEALERARRRWGIPHLVHDVGELDESDAPEIAVIATPPGPRASIIAALPSLKAVIVGKPLAASAGGAEGFADYCRRRGLLVQVNYWRRGVETFRDLAAADLGTEIGRPQAIFATYGNGLLNNASHLVDFVRMLAGEVAEVQAIGEPVAVTRPAIEGDVNLAFSFTLKSGATAACMPLDFARYREVGVDIWGEAGRMTVFQESLSLARHRRVPNRGVADSREIASDASETEPVAVDRALYALYGNLAASINHGEGLWSPVKSALATERVLHGALRSAAHERRPIELAIP